MVTIEDAIFTRASGHEGLAGHIADRAYPRRLPEGVILPAMSYGLIDDIEPQAMGQGTGVTTARFQLTAWAETFDAARDISVEIRAAFKRWRGTWAGIDVQDSLPAGRVEDNDAEAGLYWRHQDFLISYAEA
jgi:uncharacterized protein DUF3168